jgi:hypothetical protein
MLHHLLGLPRIDGLVETTDRPTSEGQASDGQ